MVGAPVEFLSFLEAIRTGGGGVVSPDMARAMMSNQTGDLAIVTNGPGLGFGFGGAVARSTPRSRPRRTRRASGSGAASTATAGSSTRRASSASWS